MLRDYQKGRLWSLKATCKDTLAFRRDYHHKIISRRQLEGHFRDYDLYDYSKLRVFAKSIPTVLRWENCLEVLRLCLKNCFESFLKSVSVKRIV